jgi:Lon protease-like protein
MGAVARYRTPADLPARIPIFPLGGALLLPRGQLPLNIFEPRYLQMVDDALAGARVIGMVQPDSDEALQQQGDPAARPSVYRIGCAGRIASFAETGDGRILITLAGISRFSIIEELAGPTPYRVVRADFAPFASDFEAGLGQDQVDRSELLRAFKAFLEAHKLEADWDEVREASNESLVNTLSMMSPYPPAEKQALLEAHDLKTRAEVLVALTDMALARAGGTSQTRLQ